ncbi:MAG: cell division protein FtsL [Candidatus Aminicenantes bacterium]|nr:cell division protein FtsL [Candidatus Aminicenantes bacterium]
MVRKKFEKKEIAAAAGCILLAIATLTFYIWHQAAIIQLGYQTSRLEENKARLGEDIKRLETERAALLAPDRVDRIAREELRLVEPKPEQIIYEDIRRTDDPT